MELGVYKENSRLNIIYIHIGQMLTNLYAKLTNVFPFQMANFLFTQYPFFLSVLSFLSHIQLSL